MFLLFMLIFTQVILESFPVSSSGHLVLLENILPFFCYDSIVSISGNKVISHFLHGPTVVVLAAFFFDRWFFLLQNIRSCWSYIFKIISLAFVADLVTLFWFLLFKYFVDVSSFPVGVGFLVSIFCLISLKYTNKKTYSSVTYKKAFLIGAVQGISLLPGVSRFGITFVAGRWLGLSPKKSFEFSFVILWPLIFFGFLKSLFKIFNGDCFVSVAYILNRGTLICIIIASIIAFFALHLAKVLAISHRLWWFAIFLGFSFVSWLALVLLTL